MMKARKELKIAGLVVLIACAGLFGFDQYMKATWDHHIVGKMWDRETIEMTGTASSIKRLGFDKWSNLTLEERGVYKNLYPEKLEIKKQGDEYIWVSDNNKRLVKTIELDGRLKSIIFTEPETGVKIDILVNKYLSFFCTESSWTGNAGIYFPLDNGDVIRYGFHTKVYQGLIMYMSCGN